MAEPSPAPAIVVAFLLWLGFTGQLPVIAPELAHEVDCLTELKQVSDLLSEVAWWRYIACCLAGLVLCLVAALAAAAWTLGLFNGYFVGRCGRRAQPRHALEAAAYPVPPNARRSSLSVSHGF